MRGRVYSAVSKYYLIYTIPPGFICLLTLPRQCPRDAEHRVELPLHRRRRRHRHTPSRPMAQQMGDLRTKSIEDPPPGSVHRPVPADARACSAGSVGRPTGLRPASAVLTPPCSPLPGISGRKFFRCKLLAKNPDGTFKVKYLHGRPVGATQGPRENQIGSKGIPPSLPGTRRW